MNRRFALLLLIISAPFVVSEDLVVYTESVWDDLLEDASVGTSLQRPFLSVRTLAANRWSVEDTGELPFGEYLPTVAPLVSAESVTLYALPTVVWTSANSAYPSGANDGAAWQGRGINTAVTSGVRFESPYLSATLAPQLWSAQNTGFELLPSVVESEYGYFTRGIDLYQRPGDDFAGAVTWGESEIRVGIQRISIGFGTTSVWLGPAQKNPILLSTNAQGFPKFDILMRPAETRIGTFEVLAFWGQIRESDYFDEESGNDRRLISTLSLSYRPRFIAGLTLGFHRIVLTEWSGSSYEDALLMFVPDMSRSFGADERDQRGSITVDWRFPAVGFNVYAEWAKNDYSSQWRNIVRAPEHSQAFTIGGRQQIRGPFPGYFMVSGEITQLILSRDYYIDLGASTSGFYTHSVISQGHTNLGQVLGAGIGTGAAAQSIDVEYVYRRGSAALFIERTARNQDYLYGASDADEGDIINANVEMRYGARSVFLVSRNVALDAEFSIADNINRNYDAENDVINVYGRVGATMTF